MKIILLNLLVIAAALGARAQHPNSVNAILGDESFVVAFHLLPNEETDEVLRLQTHLRYVENLLANKDVAHLTETQKTNRAFILRLLHDYWENAIFPRNHEYEDRRPCFIDRDGNICAVGYLIEKTAGRQMAEDINQKHQYDYLLDMNEDVIAKWANEYGLTVEECAAIQPSYGYWPPAYNAQTQAMPIKTAYGISSGFAMGVNAGMMLMNVSPRFASPKTVSCIGLVSGTSQIVLGIVNIRKDETGGLLNGPAVTYSYKAQNNLSYLNIAAGTATVLTSTFNLLLNRKLKDKRNAFNVYGYPGGGQQAAAGFSFTRTL